MPLELPINSQLIKTPFLHKEFTKGIAANIYRKGDV